MKPVAHLGFTGMMCNGFPMMPRVRGPEPSEAAMYLVRSPEDLGRAIAELRRSRGLTQDALADRIGVDRSYLTKLERGHSSPLLDLVFDTLIELEANVTVTGRGETSEHG